MIFTLLFSIISIHGFSQFQKHDFIAGGSIEFNKQLDYDLLFNVEGLIGYYLSDRISLGTRLAISDTKMDGDNTLVDFIPYMRFNVINKRYQIHAGTGGLMQLGNTTWRLDSKREFKPGLFVGMGLNVTDNFIIDIVYDTYYFSKYVNQLNVDQALSIFFIARF